MKQFFIEMLSETGTISWMRVASTSIIFTILAVFASHNIKAIIKDGEYKDFGVESVVVILSTLGAKAYQRKIEGSSDTDPKKDDV